MSREELFGNREVWRISSDRKNATHTFGVIREGTLCVVEGNTVHICTTTAPFTDSPHLQNTVFVFEFIIDSIGWERGAGNEGGLLVAGDRKGSLHFFNPKSKDVLFSQSLVTKNGEGPIFADIQFGNEDELFVLMSNGNLTVFKIALPFDLKSVIEDSSNELQNRIQMSVIDLSSVHGNESFSILPLKMKDENLTGFISTGDGPHPLSFWKRGTNNGHYNFYDSINHCIRGMKLIRCEVTSCGKYLITLSDIGTLCLWLKSSLILVNIWADSDQRVQDFCVVTSSSIDMFSSPDTARSKDKRKLDNMCLITKDGLGQTSLKVLSLPNFQVLHSMEVPSHAQLFHGDITEGSMYYLDVEHSSGIQVFHLAQTLPENRLALLLAQHRFKEAESFAVEYNINIDLVHKTQAVVLNDQLSSEFTTSDTEAYNQTMTLLKECLDKIEDQNFVVDEIIFTFQYQSLELTLTMLNYVSKKLKDPSLLVRVTSALNHLITFRIIITYQEKVFSSSSWLSFLNTSSVDKVKQYLYLGDLRCASCIQERHMGLLVQELNSTDLLSMLSCVPESVNSLLLGEWLSRYIVPLTLQYFPQALNELLHWIEERIRLLELSEKEGWPGNGLHLVTIILETISSFQNPSLKMSIQPQTLNLTEFNHRSHGVMDPLSGLKCLCNTLTDLEYLHSHLQCSVTISEYEGEPRETVVYHLLDQIVAAELVVSVVKSKVVPYVDKHGLKLESVLINYLKLLFTKTCWCSCSMAGSPHEYKAIAILETIEDKEIYLSGCVELLKHTQPPWSDAVEDLVQTCLKLDHPSVSILTNQYRLLQLRKLLHGYQIRDFNFSDLSRGLIYIRKILCSGAENSLNDALEVADMYKIQLVDVYKHYLVTLVHQGKIEEGSDVLLSLPLDLRIGILNHVLAFASSKLEMPFCKDLESEIEREGDLKLILLSLQVLRKGDRGAESISLEEEWFDIVAAIKLYKRILSLQVEFSVYLSPSELADREKCVELLTERVEDYVMADQRTNQGVRSGNTSSSTTSYSLYRFCFLLGFEEQEVTNAVVLNCTEKGHFGIIKKFWSDGNIATTPSLLLTIVQKYWSLIESTPEGVDRSDMEFLKIISSHALTYCSKFLLVDSIEVYQLCLFLSCLQSQCTEMEETLDANSGDNLFSSWTWSHRYRDDGLLLDQGAILPLAARYARHRIPEPSLPSSSSSLPPSPPSCRKCSKNNWSSLCPLDSQSVSFKERDCSPALQLATQLSSILRDHNHTQLTLHCTTNALAMLTQQVATNNPLGATNSSFNHQMTKGQNVVSNLLDALLRKTLFSRRVDHDYALALLLMLPVAQAIPTLLAINTHKITSFSRVIALCKLSIDFALIRSQPEVRGQSSNILKSAEWGRTLSHFKVSYTGAFKGGMEEKRKVAASLLRMKEIEIETVIRYCCEVVGQEEEHVLFTYLRVILTQWEDQYKERAETIMSRITNKHLMAKMCSSLLAKISPYDYERISFLLDFLLKRNSPASLKLEQGLLVLDCLRHYKRSLPPSNYEIQYFHKMESSELTPNEVQVKDGEVLPQLSTSRLPFHTLLYGDSMSIITPELTISSVFKLTVVARILKVPMDKFYLSSIRKITLSCEGAMDLDPLIPLLDKVEDRQAALVAAKWLVKHLSGDESKAKAMDKALAVARQCKELTKTESELKAAKEMEEACGTMVALNQTKLLLQQHQLNQPKYTDLVEAGLGEQLIIQLYTDSPEIITSERASPIHSIASEVASLFKISLSKVHSMLYEQWLLSFSSLNKDMNATQVSMLEDPTEELSETDSEDKLVMRRLVYLLNIPEKLESNSILLLNWARRTSSPVGCLSRVRALQILFAIASPTLIETVSGTSVGDIRDFMQNALFVCELEGLHFSTSLSVFQNSNKEGLVRTLWRNHSQEPKALRLVGELCLHYDIQDGELWGRLLRQLLKLAMLPYLRYVLKKLASSTLGLSVSSMSKIWQKVLLSPLETVSPPLSPFQREECDESLSMVYRCPFPLQLDMCDIIDHFVHLELRVHALSCALMMPIPEDQEKAVMSIFANLEAQDYIHLLNQLDSGSLVTNQYLKDLIYVHLDRVNLHEALLGSDHFSHFVIFLISKKRLNGLLTKSLQLGRHQEAVQLVEMYYKQHLPTSALTGKDALKDYITKTAINSDILGTTVIC